MRKMNYNNNNNNVRQQSLSLYSPLLLLLLRLLRRLAKEIIHTARLVLWQLNGLSIAALVRWCGWQQHYAVKAVWRSGIYHFNSSSIRAVP